MKPTIYTILSRSATLVMSLLLLASLSFVACSDNGESVEDEEIILPNTEEEESTDKEETTDKEEETTDKEEETTDKEESTEEDEEETPDDGVVSTFVHNGLIHTTTSITNMKYTVAMKQPKSEAYKCYLYFIQHAKANSTYSYSAAEDMDYQFVVNNYVNDLDAMHMCALRYAVTGETDCAAVAANIILNYMEACTVYKEELNTNTPLNAGKGFNLVCAYELLKGYGTFYETNLTRFKTFVKEMYLPVIEYFYDLDPYTNGNWGLSVSCTYLAIATFLDDKEMYEDAKNKFLYREDNGSLYYYLDRETGQCQETGRDQGHVQFGLSRAVAACEIAWNQGDDLYSMWDNVLLKGFEYTAKILLNYLTGTDYEVPFYTWSDMTTTKKYSNWGYVNKDGGDSNNYYRPCWVTAYNHYVNRMGLEMPYTLELIEYAEWGKNTTGNNYYFYDCTWYEIFQFNTDYIR